jgi:hypothetical protein
VESFKKEEKRRREASSGKFSYSDKTLKSYCFKKKTACLILTAILLFNI